MNIPKSQTVRMRISDIRNRCRELLEDPEFPPSLRLEDADEQEKGSGPNDDPRQHGL
jgi:hypothetical protein